MDEVTDMMWNEPFYIYGLVVSQRRQTITAGGFSDQCRH